MGGRFMAEFERHQGTIIMYPFRGDIWRHNAEYIRKYIVQLAKCIARYEHVYIVCRKNDISLLTYLENGNITLISSEYDDIWARDIGPTFIEEEGKVKSISWKFNAWGGIKEGSYHPWDKDNDFASKIAGYFGIPSKQANIVLEGGAILTDGEGTLFSTRSVVFNRNRNPFKSFSYIDGYLKEWLHLKNIVWLDRGLVMDETNGHIDNVMSVVRPHEICIAWTDDPANPNYKRVRAIERSIMKEYDCILHKVPLPPSLHMTSEEAAGLEKRENALERNAQMLLPASYLNYYYVNSGVIIPAFDCEEDEIALEIFENIFKDRKIEQIYSREPLLGGGGIHCILHEIPEMRQS